MNDNETLDPDDAAPLVAAWRVSNGDTRATLLGALVRLPLGAEHMRELGIGQPAQAPLMRPRRGERERRGFTRYTASAAVGLEARLAELEPPERWPGSGAESPSLDEEVAPAAVTRWFARAVGDYADIDLGNRIVSWVSVQQQMLRPDLDGLFAQYRRAALAECAAWGQGRLPGAWFLGDPDYESWHGYRALCWQIGWTVSRGGLRGLVPGLQRQLAAEDDTERAIAGLLIADAADYVLTPEPPLFGGGYGPPTRNSAEALDPATLRRFLREAAQAGVVPVSSEAGNAPLRAREPAPGRQSPARPADSHRSDYEATVDTMPEYATRSRERRPWGPSGSRAGLSWPGAAVVGLAVLGGGLAIAKWLLGWLTIDVDAPPVADVQCSVFAPPAASPGTTILVQVFAHLPEEADDARAIATELDVEAHRRAFRTLNAPVPLGARLDFELLFPGLDVDQPVAALKWRGRTEAVQFAVRIPAAAPRGAVIGTLWVSLDGVPLGHIKFKLEIEAATGMATEPQGTEARRYRSAFISYASPDRDEVLRRVQMLPLTGLQYFQDVLDLEPGEIWSSRLEQAIRNADVFLLFWSTRAKASEWVRKEVDFAIACKGGDDLLPPEIRPVIIEGPPVVAPWEDLAHMHFDDRVLYFMNRRR